MLVFAALAAAGPVGAGELERLDRPLDAACARHGPGFAPLAGTTTCVRVAGRIRAEAEAVRARGAGDGGAIGASGRVSIDARTETNLGPARAFVRFGNGRVTGADRDR